MRSPNEKELRRARALAKVFGGRAYLTPYCAGEETAPGLGVKAKEDCWLASAGRRPRKKGYRIINEEGGQNE